MDDHHDSKHPVRRRAYFGLGLMLVAALFLAACGNDSSMMGSGGGVEVGAQPERNGRFVPGEFTALPMPAGARSFAGPSLKDGAWTQSFEVDSLSPVDTMQFYMNALQSSWGQSPPLSTEGPCDPSGGAPGSDCTFRAVWRQGTERLTIIAGPAGLSVDNGTELNLLLTGAE
jgi:hypothetical protein